MSCPAEDCFAGTKEAACLEQNAAKYGFIIRYPKGKDTITGYKYEPWHLRYVGKDVAVDVTTKGITLEEYFNTQPVSK
jgi:D-alanyl-D-alanine carboxypeptidase